jgi:hypothetical protein
MRTGSLIRREHNQTWKKIKNDDDYWLLLVIIGE